MKLIGYNLAQQNETIVTASSANVNFPVRNVKHEFRAKEWRSAGCFVLTELNNKISFSESGPELEAEIAQGTYTVETLRAAIETALNSEGSFDYEVSFGATTGIWTIASSDEFDLLNLSGSNPGSLLSTLGYADSDFSGSDGYYASRIAIHTEESVTFDMRTTEPVDSVVLLWAKGEYRLSDTAIVKVQANATNTWDSPGVNETLELNDTYEIASHHFADSQTFRYWRIVVSDPSNANLYVSLGVAIIGQSEILTNTENGFVYSQTDNSKITQTDFGQEYVDEYPMFANLTLNFKMMEFDVAEALLRLYSQIGSRRPVFIAIDPTDAIFGRDCFAIYGKFGSTLALTHYFSDVFQTGLSIREIN